MSKFKVGDKVRIVGYSRSANLKKKCYGTTGVITKVHAYYTYPYEIDSTGDWRWCDAELEPVTDQKIVITRKGNSVIAKLYDDNNVKSAEAKCSPEDKFDFMVGAELALTRLNCKSCREAIKPKYYSGKVVCVESGDSWFTVGKVYEFINGRVRDDDGDERPTNSSRYSPLASLDEPNTWLTIKHLKFIPFVEG